MEKNEKMKLRERVIVATITRQARVSQTVAAPSSSFLLFCYLSFCRVRLAALQAARRWRWRCPDGRAAPRQPKLVQWHPRRKSERVALYLSQHLPSDQQLLLHVEPRELAPGTEP